MILNRGYIVVKMTTNRTLFLRRDKNGVLWLDNNAKQALTFETVESAESHLKAFLDSDQGEFSDVSGSFEIKPVYYK